MSDDLIKVANLDGFDRSGLQVVEFSGREVLLCRSGQSVYAVDNLCSHAAERLCNGRLKGERIYCPLHGAAFDIKTGEALSRPASVPIDTFEVVLQEGEIFLRTGGGQ